MKKISTTIILLFVALVGYAQTTIVDFENPADYTIAAWEGTSEVVSNTITNGINASASAGKYTIPAGKSWGNAAVVILNNSLQLKDLEKLSFMVLAPSTTQMYVKLEMSSGGGIAEAYATPSSSNEWQVVELSFSALSGVDVETAVFDKLVFFFNVNDNVGGEEWLYDNVVFYEKLEEPVAPTNLQITNITSDSFTLTWENDANATNGTNIFIEEEAAATGNAWVTTVAAGTTSYTYQGTVAGVEIAEGHTYIARIQALPDADGNAYAQTEVVITSTDVGSVIQNNITVYPNPVKDYLTISADFDIQSVEIYSVSGKLVDVKDIAAGSKQLYMGEYANGLYLINVIGVNNQNKTFRLVKQ